MNWDGAHIQIEQRVPRCARCGKMINLRGRFFELESAGRARVLVCSEICRDELAALTKPAPAVDDNGSTA